MIGAWFGVNTDIGLTTNASTPIWAMTATGMPVSAMIADRQVSNRMTPSVATGGVFVSAEALSISIARNLAIDCSGQRDQGSGMKDTGKPGHGTR